MLLAVLFPIAVTGERLPEPLTLEAALNTAANPSHFELVAIDQRLEVVKAEMGIEKSSNGFSLDLTGRIREVGLSDEAFTGDDTDDSAASLILSKPLYDFGRQDSLENKLALQLQALEHQKRLVIEQRRLQIMEKYFDVLNADNNFISENEALAIGFIRYDNAVQDLELGRVAEIEVLRLQSEYEVTRQKRALAMQQQRLTRAILAEAMGNPSQIPSDLEVPAIDNERQLPDDITALTERALQFSLEAQVVRANTRAAQAAIDIAAATDNPSLELELEASTYERDSRLRDDWRASLYFEIPLYSSSPAEKIKLAQAHYNQALANQHKLHSHLRLEVLKLWQQIQQLQLEYQGRIVEQDYRDKYLDRSRAEYELEFKTDLGDSMVLFSRSNTERQRVLYALEVAYQRLAALVGTDFLNQLAKSQ